MPWPFAAGDGSQLGAYSSTTNIQFGGTNYPSIQLLRQTGAKWVRIEASWSSLANNITALNGQVAAIVGLGLTPIMTINNTPDALSINNNVCCNPDTRSICRCNFDPNCVSIAPNSEPANFNAFATFCTNLATNYVPQGVFYYQVWNEPNLVGNWIVTTSNQCGTDDYTKSVTDYRLLLHTAYTSLRAVDTRVKVLMAGMAWDECLVNPNSPTCTKPQYRHNFFRDCMDNSGTYGPYPAYDNCDIVDFHFYGTADNRVEQLKAWIEVHRDALYPHAHKPIFCTETGVQSNSSPSLPNQTDWIKEIFPVLLENGVDVGLYFQLFDLGSGTLWGLIDPLKQPKRGYYAFRDFIQSGGYL